MGNTLNFSEHWQCTVCGLINGRCLKRMLSDDNYLEESPVIVYSNRLIIFFPCIRSLSFLWAAPVSLILGELAVVTFISHCKLFTNLPKVCRAFFTELRIVQMVQGLHYHFSSHFLSPLFPASKRGQLLHKAFCAPHICSCCQLLMYQVWGGGRNMRCANNSEVLPIQGFSIHEEMMSD